MKTMNFVDLRFILAFFGYEDTIFFLYVKDISGDQSLSSNFLSKFRHLVCIEIPDYHKCSKIKIKQAQPKPGNQCTKTFNGGGTYAVLKRKVFDSHWLKKMLIFYR